MEHATRLLETDLSMAAQQAQEILTAVPDYPPAALLLATSHRLSGDPARALQLLQPLIRVQVKWAAAFYEFGLSLAAVGRGEDAILALRKTVKLKPEHPEAWRVLADHLLATGETEAGDAAYTRHIQCSTRNPNLQRAAAAMIEDDMPVAERLLKTHLSEVPTDVPAIRMLAEVAVRCGRDDDAMKLVERCLELAPSFHAARYNYAVLLHRHNDSESALTEIERLMEVNPNSPSYRNLYAVILSRVGEYERSSSMYKKLLDQYPNNSKVWLSYGHVLKTEGRIDDCIDAYRKSIALNPSFGEAYWSLANLKTFQFADDELSAMGASLAQSDLDVDDRLHFHFSLGKAFEDAQDYEKSFEHYDEANRLYREGNSYDADKNTARAHRLKKSFSREFFEERAGSGFESSEPIFIVGMPRSGSTLLEQILSSHSAVEGTTELPDIISMAMELREEADSDEIVAYADVLASKSRDELKEMGQQYIERTQVHRKSDRPFFIDKMPNNFLHIGMIQAILPNAKIIDARRHPLGCCFSNFKQYYARGQSFSYGLTDMGRFYRDYVELMAHFDEVLPGRIYRASYEKTVNDTEAEVRKILDYCGLPFEEGCLRFFENKRPVRTASSEQVRQPIYRQGMEQWQNYEKWLDPLKDALGTVLDEYPEAPEF